MVESQTIVTPFVVKNVLSVPSISLQHLFLFPKKLCCQWQPVRQQNQVKNVVSPF